MININELRIGNLIRFDGHIFKVIGVSSYHEELWNVKIQRNNGPVFSYYNNDPLISPIPITQELIAGFNFAIDPHGSFILGENQLLVLDGNGVHFIFHNLAVCIQDQLINLHQLQNVYFAINGTELNLL